MNVTLSIYLKIFNERSVRMIKTILNSPENVKMDRNVDKHVTTI